MDTQKISVQAICNKRVSIIGYGNQGRAHALNLRDSGVNVKVGARPGKGFDLAVEDGFQPVSPEQATEWGDIVMFLLPDQTIPAVYKRCSAHFKDGSKIVGFAHGFVVTYRLIEFYEDCSYILVSPKGAGALLRQRYCEKSGLPGVFALDEKATAETREVCLSYAKAAGIGVGCLLETSFREETECDLFGEQVVLCGGIMQLMEKAFNVLVKNGHSTEMAFFECCFEARLILDLWLKFGPYGHTQKISPTAFYGGLTRGKRLISDTTEKEMESIFREIRSGAFANEWMREVTQGAPRLEDEGQRLRQSQLEKVYQSLKDQLP